ncbi:MAG TPA: CvpA family protein [Candidatus Omnitrophota bacterium]|nr:CvpA family protein [Candidatus Omnitrophota bacterium]HPT38941.1 CvpA family protein [Candidatus Omnitrophota bacterium]
MIAETLAKFNFLDFIILIVLFRICYIAAKMGLSIELFKLAGVIFSTYISLHYYVAVSDLIQRRFFSQIMPLAFMDFIVFILLVIVGYSCFILLRSLLFRFVQLNAVPRINQVAGLILGIFRSFLIVGLISFTLSISTVTYISNSVRHSYLGSRAFAISPRTYDWLWSNIFSKFSAHEKFNSTVAETMDKFYR